MKRVYYLSIFFLLIQQIFAAHVKKALFNVSATGVTGNISFTLCLNGTGSLSCQNYSASALDLHLSTTIPHHTYPAAGIKLNTPGYTPVGCTPLKNGYCLFSVSDTASTNIGISNNPPWYPSMDAFEHYDSNRSHLFANANFGGNFSGNNTVTVTPIVGSYPSVYNMTTIDTNSIFAYGGAYGNNSTSIGSYVAKLNSNLQQVWYNQLINTANPSSPNYGEWDYPGVMGILADGYIYVVYGYRLAKINPTTGTVIATLTLPSGPDPTTYHLPFNTAYNGFDATPNGILIMKAIYRPSNCENLQGPLALSDCNNPNPVPHSVLVTVNPQSMQVIDQTVMPFTISGRITVGEYNGQSYAYLFGPNAPFRYIISSTGQLTYDSSWNPGQLLPAGNNGGSALVVLGNWVAGQSNGDPTTTPLTVIAVNQGNASLHYTLQPFAGDPIPLVNQVIFGSDISWMPSSISVDPDTNIIYAMDAIPGEIAAIKLTASGLQTLWKRNQVTTEFMALIGPSNARVLVGTDIPLSLVPTPSYPGGNVSDYVVWRNAATGAEIARTSSALTTQITSGSMIQPTYNGNMIYEGVTANGDGYYLQELIPSAN